LTFACRLLFRNLEKRKLALVKSNPESLRGAGRFGKRISD
jgi:hypothetical protein